MTHGNVGRLATYRISFIATCVYMEAFPRSEYHYNLIINNNNNKSFISDAVHGP